jgi:hypothetical protein
LDCDVFRFNNRYLGKGVWSVTTDKLGKVLFSLTILITVTWLFI